MSEQRSTDIHIGLLNCVEQHLCQTWELSDLVGRYLAVQHQGGGVGKDIPVLQNALDLL
jgi:hypothetical protein